MTIWAPGSVYAYCLIKITSHTCVLKKINSQTPFSTPLWRRFRITPLQRLLGDWAGETESDLRAHRTEAEPEFPSVIFLLPRLIEVNLIHNSARHAQLCDCSNVMKNELQSQSLWWRFNNSSELDKKKKRSLLFSSETGKWQKEPQIKFNNADSLPSAKALL